MGLRTKGEDFCNYTCENDYDIYDVTKSWLNDDSLSSELYPDWYDVLREDRNESLSDRMKGGGILLVINSRYQSMFMPCNILSG